MVNRVAFLPDRDYALGDAQLPVDVRHLFLNTNDGERIEVRGCDLWTFGDEGTIVRKDSFWKLREP